MFWLNNIPLKNIINIKLCNKLQNILNNMTNLSSILILNSLFKHYFLKW